ncbi:hypothetical protein H8356DRAFT_1686677 [Neocallimastix lanati (nom. inval.)]|jgi:hypothetical protein|uniref:HAD-like protein n=1 Tax=Neocallimastix californiae TaxID=1754190 RepID=A0A1Y2FPF6_9FUNG|nr:hypothetical protein H8356DRAFT_1686677 [Neocallimastix sp. JGI-2020a]ORY85214.1 hypothetical protein LY90DRAFT_448371 [Neocallimastix californiae]|eukprot:ORY85214.1 hypothetical protein LY90DRAFT_448371 [Neocallimastix californiae]
MTITELPDPSNIKLLVADVDGTLLNSKGKLTTKTKDVIKKVIQKYPSIRFVISTGKSEHAIEPLREELELTKSNNHPTSCNNGCVVYGGNNEVLNEYWVEPQDVIEIIELCEEYRRGETEFNFGLYFKNDMIFLNKDSHFYRLRDFYKEKAIYMERDEFLQKLKSKEITINKICIFNKDIDLIKVFRKEVLAPFIAKKSQLGMTQTGKDCLEVMSKEGNKGSSLNYLLQTFQLTKDQVLAFGDGENDLPMFEVSQQGVAMANAVDILKNNAKYITKSNDEDGLAVFLENVFLSK